MGQAVRRRIFLLSAMLTFTGIIISWNGYVSHKKFTPSSDLLETISKIPNWKLVKIIPLNPSIIEALQLDDYVNFIYSNGKTEIFLYIGQYYSNQQVGAAHDPMVCFPGQGWTISQRTKGNISVETIKNNSKISYSSMITQSGDQKNFVVYWFQAHDLTYNNTFAQKLFSLWNTLSDRGQSNAFVRISTNFESGNTQIAEDRILQFIKDFYPIYFHYITS